ncbi:hypothetical protein [Escherichia albertii]|uniref:hypothetical protein n=1 Tax=Escherichia albertii TaxID=208962 RepID=UPI0011F3AD61|nr:hypothetical protein [Escherichia albertii]MCZ9149936.1 hypothetical protein [Escherichia albertii]MCZ9167938.1 hypothetical protein [Escherichia albertii]
MQNIILLFIYLLLIAVNHFRYKFLLSGNAGEMILYFANVFFNPLAVSFIIATIICITIKKRSSRSFIRGTCWLMGLFLIYSSYTVWERHSTWDYTFPGPGITVTVPSKQWVFNMVKQGPILVTRDAHAILIIVAFSQNELGVHSIKELTAAQAGTPELHICDIQGFTCAYQEGIQTMSDGKVRHAIFMTLLNNTNLIRLTAAIDPDYLDEYREDVMKMMLSARQ